MQLGKFLSSVFVRPTVCVYYLYCEKITRQSEKEEVDEIKKSCNINKRKEDYKIIHSDNGYSIVVYLLV